MDKRRLKGATPIGGLIFAGVIIFMAVFGILGWVGSYQVATGEAANSTLAQQYNAILGSAANPHTGIFSNLSALNSSARNVSTGGVPNTALGGLSLVFSLNPISIVHSLIAIIVVAPLTSAGISVGFAWTMAVILMVVFVGLAIVSALLIFNLL